MCFVKGMLFAVGGDKAKGSLGCFEVVLALRCKKLVGMVVDTGEVTNQ